MIFKKKWFKTIIIISLTIIVVYLMIYVDLTLRARDAYLKAERYMYWHKHPDKKKEYYYKEFQKKKEKLDKKLKAGKISEEEYEREIEIAKFERDFRLKESSLKYAYVWYQTAVELFSPPRSKWVKLAEKKMPIAKEMWKEELRKEGVKFEDYMLE